MEETQTTQQDFFIDLGGRLRATEGKYNLLRDRVLLINQNMIEEWKKLTSELHLINDEIKDLKVDVFRIKETLKHLLSDLDLYARKEDVKVLEKYINLWNPMKFTTESEVQKMIAQHHNPDNGN